MNQLVLPVLVIAAVVVVLGLVFRRRRRPSAPQSLMNVGRQERLEFLG